MGKVFRYPPRRQFGDDERKALLEAFDFYVAKDMDYGSQGHFEALYSQSFVEFQGAAEGYCDAVSSGTAALFVALRGLELKKNSIVLVSPITDPGCISAIIMNDLIPKIVDTSRGSYNTDLNEIEARLEDRVSAVLLVHSSGSGVVDTPRIAQFCKANGLKLIEDCSQAHGAFVNGRRVGTFGHVAALSTMNTKNHSSGGCGGLIYTRSKEIYERIRMHTDRGKPFHAPDFDPKNPSCFGFPALNFSQDELSCAVGFSTLKKLERTRKKRIELLQKLQRSLETHSSTCKLTAPKPDDSPFFWPILFNGQAINCSKNTFASQLLAAGVPINPRYRYLVSEWPWAQKYLSDHFQPVNARSLLEESFNLLIHEGFDFSDIDEIVEIIVETETYLLNRGSY
jgi:perosamine synthetase